MEVLIKLSDAINAEKHGGSACKEVTLRTAGNHKV